MCAKNDESYTIPNNELSLPKRVVLKVFVEGTQGCDSPGFDDACVAKIVMASSGLNKVGYMLK
jgi:hypothetical protein